MPNRSKPKQIQKVFMYHTDKSKLILAVKIYVLSLITCLLFSVAASAQSGKLTGKVTDEATNEPLAGVSITVKGKKTGTSTITDGTYILTLAPGNYTIVVSYQSYNKTELSGIIIKPGETSFQDFILKKADNKLGEVVITSSVKKEAQSALYSAQKTSAGASDGISKEAINKTPDNNAGQILKRVTGVNVQDNRFVVVRGLGDQYNQTTLNGVPMTSTETNRNAFAFDLIPAAVIDNITINKTATPDMPGNFAGGIVKINTKDFPANDFFSITVQGSFSDETLGKDFYNDKRGKYEVLSFGGGQRDLPKAFPSNISRVPFGSYNQQEQFRLLRQLNNNLAPVNYGPSKPNENVQLGYGKTINFKNKTQLGIVAAINQRKTELIENETQGRGPVFSRGEPGGDTLQALGIYSKNLRYRYSADFGGVLNIAYRFGNNKIMLKNLYTRVLNNIYIDRDLIYFDNETFQNFNKGITHFIEERAILNSGLSGEHRTGNNNETRIDWNFNVTANRIYNPDQRNYILQGDSTYITSSLSSTISNILYGLSRVWSDNKDLIYGGAFNIVSPFNLINQKQLFKTGVLFQNRTRNATGVVLPITNSSARTGTSTAHTIGSFFAPDNFKPGDTFVDIGSADIAGGGGNYDAGSSLLATYVSLENKIKNKTRLIWGIRAENYQQTVNIYTNNYYNNILQPERPTIYNSFASRNTFNFLPSVNLVYSPVKSINLRAAFSKTVIRPELKDIAPYQRFDLITFALTAGNANLKSSSVSNYDFKFEWFPSAGEIVSFAAFYKKILNPVEYTFAYPNTTTSPSIKVPLNTGETFVRGLEAEARKKVDFIKAIPWLSHVTIFGNGALIKSKVAFVGSDPGILQFGIGSIGEHRLTGQAKYILNTGISILLMKETLEATVSFNKTGDYITEIGSNDGFQKLANGATIDLAPNFWLKSRNLLDLVITKSILKNKGKFKFNISNLLKQGYTVYQDLNGNGKFDSEIVLKNIPNSFPLIESGIDNVPQGIIGQRNFSLAFTYTF